MKLSLYFLLFTVLLFTSCKEDEVPQNFLSGTYELAQENTDTGIWYVHQYVFKSDGTVEIFYILRTTKTGPDLGYSSYTTGTYTLRGEEFTLKRLKNFSLDYEKFPEGYTPELEELTESEMGPFAESKGTLKRQNNGEKISILFECNDVIGFQSMCIGEQKFVRVN